MPVIAALSKQCVKIIIVNDYYFLDLKKMFFALTGVAQLVGGHPVKQKIMGLMPGQDTCLGYRFGPRLGRI